MQTLEEEGKQPAAETTTTITQSDPTQSTDPLQYLLPDSDEEGVVEVRVEDKGSRPQLARVNVSGVPLDRVVDTGADITIAQLHISTGIWIEFVIACDVTAGVLLCRRNVWATIGEAF